MTLTGTGALVRLALRLDRVRLPVWVLVLAVLPVATASQYKELYPDEAAIRAVVESGVLSNPSLEALGGPLFAATLGGLTAWKIGATQFILAALMSILTVTRHSRTEEETGRAELLGATVVGRHAPLTAALLTMALANVTAGALIALFLTGVGLPAAGSVALGLATALSGLTFGSVAGVTAQLSQSARAANGTALGVLGAAFLLRAAGDAGTHALNWVSPLGWLIHLRSYADERWWIAGPAVALLAVLAAAAYILVNRRDVGAGLLADRPAAPTAAPSLRSPLALAWRLHRGVLTGWLIAIAITGALFGGVVRSISDALTTNQSMTSVIEKLGGTGALTDSYLAATTGIIGITVACYTVQATLRLRTEESAGRVEPVLATRAGRLRVAASHLTFAIGGTAALLTVFGLTAGLVAGAQLGDVDRQTGRMLVASLVQAPAAWVLAGFGVLLFGLAPRLSALAWAALVACFAILELGLFLGLNQWLIDVSPFAHVPKLPGSAFTATPVLGLTLVAAVLTGVGLAGFRRRDIA